MFGTDIPIAEMGVAENYKNYIENITSVINEYYEENGQTQKADKAIDKIFYTNAKNLFLQEKKLDIAA